MKTIYTQCEVNNIYKQRLVQGQTRPKRPESAKMPNQNFQGQTLSKKAKFNLFGLTQGQIATGIMPGFHPHVTYVTYVTSYCRSSFT